MYTNNFASSIDSLKFSSDDPMVNGQQFTNDPKVKFRRDRHISKPRKWKRSQYVQEFLNYCKYRNGEIESFGKVPKIFSRLISAIKYERWDEIPNGYLQMIEQQKEFFVKAANADLRHKSKKDKNKITTVKKQTSTKKSTAMDSKQIESGINFAPINTITTEDDTKIKQKGMLSNIFDMLKALKTNGVSEFIIKF